MTAIIARDQATIPATPDQVWAVLADVRGYPGWWPQDLGLRVLSQEPGLVGSEVEIRPRGGRPFKCRVTAADPPRRMEMEYFGGFVEGRGTWEIARDAGGARVTYTLEARARGWLVAMMARFMDLGAVHSRQMSGVFEGLRLKSIRQKD